MWPLRSQRVHSIAAIPWNQGSNVFGWRAYLGREPGGTEVPAHAVPARREDLSGLPPAWLGVGTCDLFHDEDIAYARRLEAAGVPCDVVVVPGAFHGFDVITRGAGVARDFRGAYTAALRRALFPAHGVAEHAKAGCSDCLGLNTTTGQRRTRSGRAVRPRTDCERRQVSSERGTASWMSAYRRRRVRKTTFASSRASGAPRQKCGPKPNAT